MLHSVQEALSHTSIDTSSPKLVFILGTSTASVEELGDTPGKDGLYFSPGIVAKRISDKLGFMNDPITISTACVSGGSAQMLADRLVSSGTYDIAVVCGADVVSPFVLAGFSSFKSLSPTECKPFDIDRLGINIGECAATFVLTKTDEESDGCWNILNGCLNNDAYHVSAPIPSGDGVFRTIKTILTSEVKDSLACVTAHGTATMFNDQMESKAIENAGLGNIPTTAYKAHFGHTFGASGMVEPIITMCSLDEGLVLPIRGFEEIGVSGKIRFCDTRISTDKKSFIKTQSGFGGCNGAILYSKNNNLVAKESFSKTYEIVKSLSIDPQGLIEDGRSIPFESTGASLITEIYKKHLSDDSRFFKMDLYSRIAYVGSCLLAKDSLKGFEPEDVSLLLFTLNGSILADRKHISSYSNPEEYYPSPSVFINTLPNVVLGEIAVKNTIKGETTLVMLPTKDDAMMETIVDITLVATQPSAMIYGWVDCVSEDSFFAELKLKKPNIYNMEELTNEIKLQIIDALNLEEMTPDQIDNDAPLFGEGLGLDSIDALELIVILDKFYGIKLSSPEEGKAVFQSVNCIADYVQKHRTK